MRDYGKIAPSFWIGKTGKAIKAGGQEAVVVAMYLMSSPHSNMIGLYYLPMMYLAHETGLGTRAGTRARTGTRAEACKTQRGSRLPADWFPSESEIQFCKTERPDLDPAKTAERFRDYWHAQPGSKGTKLDWTATWRNWVRDERAKASPPAMFRKPSINDIPDHSNAKSGRLQ